MGENSGRARSVAIALYLGLIFGGYIVSLLLSRLARIREFLGL